MTQRDELIRLIQLSLLTGMSIQQRKEEVFYRQVMEQAYALREKYPWNCEEAPAAHGFSPS